MLELVPSEIEKVLVPSRGSDAPMSKTSTKQFEMGCPREELLAKQDTMILRPLGITKKNCRALCLFHYETVDSDRSRWPTKGCSHCISMKNGCVLPGGGAVKGQF